MTQSKLILHETFETEYIEYVIFHNSVHVLKKTLDAAKTRRF